MVNVEDFINSTQVFKKFEVDDLLFVELICPVEEEKSGNTWWHNNFFSYVVAGEMELKTIRGEYIVRAGDCIFAKKGSIISARHHIPSDFCDLRVFVPDNFIKSVFQKYRMPVPAADQDHTDTLIPLPANEVLDSYFHSLLSYFRQPLPPSGSLLRLKFEELLVSIISNNIHRPLINFLAGLCLSDRPSIKEIMEVNFVSNLSLEEFARLCCRSLSTFKKEFKDTFHVTPGKWLYEKRLEYSRYLLETTHMTIDEICMVSGFENRTHFNRLFKAKFNVSPGKFSHQSKAYTA